MSLFPVVGVLAAVALFGLTLWKPIFGLGLVFAADSVQAILPGVPYVTSLVPLVGGVTVFSYLMSQVRQREGFAARPNVIYVLLVWFLLSNLLGQYLQTLNPERNYFFTVLQLAVSLWLVDELVQGDGDLRVLAVVFVATAVVSSVVGLVADRPSELAGAVTRATGLSGNANALAIYSGIAIFLCIPLWRVAARGGRLVLVGTGLLLTVILFRSGSRGGVLFFLLTGIYLLVESRIFAPRTTVIASLMIAALAVGWQFVPDGLQERFLAIPSVIRGRQDTVGLRYDLWRAAIDLWSRSPVFGIGPGMFRYYNMEQGLVARHSALVVHNMYITVLTENGLFGFLPFAGIIAGALFHLRRARRYAQQGWLVDSSLAWEAVLVYVCLNGTKTSCQNAKVLWIAFGIALALHRLGLRIREEST